MPIKLPKGFQRRKSSGNALDDFQNGESSFRVLPRPGSSGAALEPPRPIQDVGQYRNSFDDDSEDLFSVARPDAANRGSGGTNNSLSTAPYDSAGSSRISTSSTNPSSVDTRPDNTSKQTAATNHADIPVPPIPTQRNGGFLRNAGKTFAMGVSRKSYETNDNHSIAANQKTPASSVRDRSMTVSSVTTATPPRLDDTDLSIHDPEMDGFGNMFDGIGAKSSRDPSPGRPVQYASSPASQLRAGPLRSGRPGVALPLHVSQHDQIDSSPYSWTSANSRDGMMRSPSPSKTVTQASPQFSTVRNIAGPATINPLTRTESEDDNIFEDTPLQPKADVRSTTVRSPPTSFHSYGTRERGSTIRSRISERSSTEIPGVDPTLLAGAELANRYQDSRTTGAKNASKVMTPAQFERYKMQKEETRRYNKVFGKAESDDSGDDYDDDEEDEQEKEREKLAVKQRKKQEAHLAVYRQQMVKVTGSHSESRTAANEEERPSSSHSQHPAPFSSNLDLSLPNRSSTLDLPSMSKRSSTLDLPGLSNRSSMLDIPGLSKRSSTLDIAPGNNRFSQLTADGKRSSSGGKSSQEGDEDEDVPLGILAAHGFPNKNRPPSKLMGSSSNPNLRSQAQSQGLEAGNRESRLPAFARHLPPDPYYGASIVAPARREPMSMSRDSLAMHSSHNLVPPQASGAATAHPLHPAGLVGVIAGEERARAMRRGSPNAGPGYELPPMAPVHPGMQRAQTMANLSGMGTPGVPGMPNMPGMMMPGMPNMLSPGDQAQIHMSAQMTQMMQMQMQWMQFMTQAMGQNPPGSVPPEMMGQGMPPGPQSGPVMPPVSRPQSVPLQSYPSQGQRTMSTLSPSMANWAHSSPAVPQLSQAMNSHYAPSIAPSERSNIGMASRYRPVSTIQQDPEPAWQKRSSTFTSSTLRPWSHVAHGAKGTAHPTVRPVSTIADDEDDEQGWAEMAAKKAQKKRSWKLRKGTDTSLQELYNAPA